MDHRSCSSFHNSGRYVSRRRNNRCMLLFCYDYFFNISPTDKEFPARHYCKPCTRSEGYVACRIFWPEVMFYENTDNYYPPPVSFTPHDLGSKDPLEFDVCPFLPLQCYSTKMRLRRVLSRIFLVQMPVNAGNILGSASRFPVIRSIFKRTVTPRRSVIVWALPWRTTHSPFCSPSNPRRKRWSLSLIMDWLETKEVGPQWNRHLYYAKLTN